MNEAVATRTWDVKASAHAALKTSAILWVIPAVIGQWAFAYHIATAFVAPAFDGKLEDWNKDLFVGLVAGDVAGNIALGAHLLIAFIITAGGTLQLVPQIRTHAPALHRWNGRIFIVLGSVASLAGIYMIWTRDTFGGILINDISVSLNGVLVVVFGILAMRYAMARKFELHSQWALRTFMVISGVWFVRVMYSFLGRVTQGEIPGVTDNMTGPTNMVIGFASYLLPLAVLELYFIAKRNPSVLGKFATAALVLAASGATSIGVYGRVLRWLS